MRDAHLKTASQINANQTGEITFTPNPVVVVGNKSRARKFQESKRARGKKETE